MKNKTGKLIPTDESKPGQEVRGKQIILATKYGIVSPGFPPSQLHVSCTAIFHANEHFGPSVYFVRH